MEHMDNKMEKNMKGSMKIVDLINLEEKLMENIKNIANLIQNSSDTLCTSGDVFQDT